LLSLNIERHCLNEFLPAGVPDVIAICVLPSRKKTSQKNRKVRQMARIWQSTFSTDFALLGVSGTH
jgi:hypothetical protein